MSELPLSRRAVTRALLAAPAALVVVPAAATGALSDSVWSKLVADYRMKYAAYEATADREEEADDKFYEARASLPPEPIRPGRASTGDILDRTVRELRDACDRPEHTAAWAEYERAREAWQKQCDDLRAQIVGPAEAAYRHAFALYCDAFNALSAYRVTSLRDLAEKIEIVSADYGGTDIPPEYLADILADVRQLMGEGQA